jgi:hypothetical protein
MLPGRTTLQHTLDELLARVLLEEGFVDHRARHVIDHQDDDGMDLFLSVAGIIFEGLILLVTYD